MDNQHVQVDVSTHTSVQVGPGNTFGQGVTQSVHRTPSHTSQMSVVTGPRASPTMFAGMAQPMPYGPPPPSNTFGQGFTQSAQQARSYTSQAPGVTAPPTMFAGQPQPYGPPPPYPRMPPPYGGPPLYGRPYGPPFPPPPYGRPPPLPMFSRSFRHMGPTLQRWPPIPSTLESPETEEQQRGGGRGGGRRRNDVAKMERRAAALEARASRHDASCPVREGSRERAREIRDRLSGDEDEDSEGDEEEQRAGRRGWRMVRTGPTKRYITAISRVSSKETKKEEKPKEEKPKEKPKEEKPPAKDPKMADQAIVDKLEAGFKKLQDAKDCKSLLKKYLTKDVLDKLKTRKTAMGATLLDVIQSGVENLDSGVGLYAPDAEAYTLFADLFNPVIEDYHGGFKSTDKHPPTDFGDMNTLVDLDPENKYVVSTRVRCGRSLQGYPFNPCLTEAQYKEMEEKVSSTLKTLDGELKGTYYPLTGMSKQVQQQLIDDHFLFKEGDRFLQAANACRYWPTGRGIFHNDNKTFLVWCNEEDHLRIISMQKGGDLKQVFSRMVNGVKEIEKKLPFSRDDRLGFLTFCPTNLGTTIRASVHIQLPKLAADKAKLDSIAAKYNLQVRGTRGEHTESEGGVYDISNKRRMGLTEYQAVREMQDGIQELIKLEKAA